MEFRGLRRPASVDGGEEKGPFFNHELASALAEEEEGLHRSDNQNGNAAVAAEFAFAGSCSLRRDLALSFSTSGGFCFKGRLVSVDDSKPSSKMQVPAFLLKLSAFKFGFHRRARSASTETNTGASPVSSSASPKQSKFSFKLNVAEPPPSPSAFARNRRSASAAPPAGEVLNGRKLPGDMLQRYLSKIKPHYMRISKRFDGDGKVRPGAGEGWGDQIKRQRSSASSHLSKSRSTSATASIRSSPPVSRRRDDTLLEQQDGIQSAIAHCKRSLNKGPEPSLTRSRSDPADTRPAVVSNRSKKKM
ncbi:uncharacterized protein LOC141843088 [Curcuma longa]|uniref:uncharacterized protein LOC141842676 n=1 Tax=Curcuma longa TaxID=136217 RepID=UPI003D9F5A97